MQTHINQKNSVLMSWGSQCRNDLTILTDLFIICSLRHAMACVLSALPPCGCALCADAPPILHNPSPASWVSLPNDDWTQNSGFSALICLNNYIPFGHQPHSTTTGKSLWPWIFHKSAILLKQQPPAAWFPQFPQLGPTKIKM